jgi:hypothetical protein
MECVTKLARMERRLDVGVVRFMESVDAMIEAR